MKKFKGKIFYMVLGAIILTTITVIGDTIINSSAVEYDNSGGNTSETTVEGALNELYTIVSNQSSGSSIPTISFVDNEGGNSLETIDSNSNTIPELPVPTRSGYYFVGWYDAEDGGNEIEKGSVISADTILYAHWEQIISFSTDSWEKIKRVLKYNKTAYAIGSTRTETMNLEGSNKDYVLRLSNTSTPAVCSTEGYSQTACGVVIEFVTRIGTAQMSSSKSNSTGWVSSKMRSYLNTNDNSIYSKLPDELKSVIITTKPIVSSSGSGGSSSNAFSDTNKLYLLSAREVGLYIEYDNRKDTSTDTRTLDYYNSNNDNVSRIKYTTAEGTSSTTWWLRSANGYNKTDYYCVSSDGSYTSNLANTSYGVAPAFRIAE